MDVGLVVYGDLDRTSGGYRYDRKLVSHLERRGDDVQIVSIPWGSYPRRFAYSVSRSIRDQIDRPVDVLIQDELCYPSLWRHNRTLTKPTVIVSLVHLLESGNQLSRFRSPFKLRSLRQSIERRYLQSVDAAICTSSHTRRRTAAVVDRPTFVAPPGGRVKGKAVDLETVVDRAHRSTPLEITFVGNVVPRKGVVRLCSSLARTSVDWRLTLVGDVSRRPSYARTVRDRISELGIADRVTITGRVSDERLSTIYERSHLLAVPSRYEGFGMVYLEAMEYGVVPIAGQHGGASDVVRHGKNGFLVDPTDPAEVADIVSELGGDPDRLASLGINALETAAEHPSWAETMDRVRTVLKRLVEAKSTGPTFDGVRENSTTHASETGNVERGDRL